MRPRAPRPPMTSLERVLAALGGREPDRVPFFLLLTTHGARELGLSIREYFARPEHVAEAQPRLRARFRHDCLYAFFHASLELEAWGGESQFVEDGPPTAGAPIVARLEDIRTLAPPDVLRSAPLARVLRATELLASRAAGEVPVLGVAIAPFSLPVLQLGYERYLEVLLERPDLLDHLLRVNEEFTVAWANAQLAAGATAVAYFDPLASPTLTPPETYRAVVFERTRRTLARVRGPTATHLASGRCLPIAADVARTGTAAIVASCDDDLAEVKRACGGRIAVLGNLNGIAMRRWSADDADARVRAAIAAGGPGGGYVLADHHGELPFQVQDDVLDAISDAVHRWGPYPLAPPDLRPDGPLGAAPR